MRRNVYQPGVSVPAEVCDFELVPESGVAPGTSAD